MSNSKSTKATIVEVKDIEVVKDATDTKYTTKHSWNFEPAIDMISDFIVLDTSKKNSDGKTIFDMHLPIDHNGVREHIKLNPESTTIANVMRDGLGNGFYRGSKSMLIHAFKTHAVPYFKFKSKAKARLTNVEKADSGLNALRKTMTDAQFEAFIQLQLAKVSK